MKLLIATYLFLVTSTFSAVQRVDGFSDALAAAKKADVPVAVYIHGSSWQPASKVFHQSIWASAALEKGLKNPVVMTNIHVRQGLDQETAKAEVAKNKPWNAKTVSSFPAIQIYAPDGHLLKNIQGGEFRELGNVKAVAENIDEIIVASAARSSHLAEIARARGAKDQAAETAALVALEKLPINAEPKYVDQLKAADPDDRSGLRARLEFRNWFFVRDINAQVNKGEAAGALKKIDQMLASPSYTTEQRIFIFGARGNVLVALGRFEEGWEAFQKAFQSAPDHPNAIAMHEHGRRVAGFATRRVFPAGSALEGEEIGDLLSAEATFTQSSSAHDDPANHPSLFTGALRSSAFHTAKEKGAHIVIDLVGECELRALRITNIGGRNAKRAASLRVWHSTDGKKWTKAWAAEQAEPAWEILFPSPVEARYLKVGLDPEVSNFLHLRAVDVFGERS